jgi:ribosomal protein L3 glutamine methyltransferase
VLEVAERFAKAGLVFAHGTTDPVAEAAFIVAHVLQIPPQRVEARAGTRVSSAAQQRVLAIASERVRTRKPLAYLLRRMDMRGVSFYVDERAIVPRSYLGEILDGPLFAGGGALLSGGPGAVRNILDLCTGSGCLAILAALRFPKARVDAVEISEDALEVAKRNVRDHRLAKRVRLLHGDLFAPVRSDRYDLIIANPPYVDAKGMAGLPAECRHEPRLALDGGRDGLAIVRRIVDEAGAHLTASGGLLCEIGRGRRALERAYPAKRFLWLDTEDSEGEVFWLDAAQLP